MDIVKFLSIGLTLTYRPLSPIDFLLEFTSLSGDSNSPHVDSVQLGRGLDIETQTSSHSRTVSEVLAENVKEDTFDCNMNIIPLVSGRLSRRVFSLCKALVEFCIRVARFEPRSRLTRIQDRAFFTCSSLESICLPRTVELLCDKCFAGCDELRIVEFESNSQVTCIEGDAFRSNYSLESLCIPSMVRVLCHGCFSRCEALRLVTFGLSPPSISEDSPDFNLEFASELCSIGSGVFALYGSLQSLFIPAFVHTIDELAFSYSDIREIVVASDNRHFRVRDPFYWIMTEQI
jgi:hypothetical protein